MKNKDARIYVASIAKISKRLTHYGDADISNISLLKLIYKYACYSSTYSQIQRLDKMVARLQREDPYICLEKQASGTTAYTSPVGTVPIGVDGNVAPTLTGSSITLSSSDDIHAFTYAEIFSGYSDDSNGLISSFVISTIPANGTLSYNGQLVVAGTLLYDPTKLIYARSNNTAYGTSFNYYAYDDDSQLPLASNAVACTVTVDAIVVENSPATVGNTNVYSDNRVITVFSSATFTSDAIAPYSDPDGDPLDAIKVLGISAVNGGVYYYFSAPVVVGQVITKAELDSGAFYHSAADSNAITTDSIQVAVRDTGSMIWVE